MSQFFADLDGTTKARFSLGSNVDLRSTPGRITIEGDTPSTYAAFHAGQILAFAPDDDPNLMGGGVKIVSDGGSGGIGWSNTGVKLLASPDISTDYSLRFPATPPQAGQVQLMVAQGENLSFVPLATLAAGAVKVEKKIVQFANGDAAWVTLPPQAEIWRLRMVVKTAYAGFTAPPRLTVGITGNLGQFLDVNFANINNTAGTIIDLSPKVMEASGAALVVGFTGNGATAGQLALYCEYMIPNV